MNSYYDKLGMSAYPTNENRMMTQTVFFPQVMFIYVEAYLNENYIFCEDAKQTFFEVVHVCYKQDTNVTMVSVCSSWLC